MTKIPKYDWRNGSDDQQMSYNEKVNEVKWDELVDENDDVDKKLKILLKKIEKATKGNFENKAEKKIKHKIQKAIKKLY